MKNGQRENFVAHFSCFCCACFCCSLFLALHGLIRDFVDFPAIRRPHEDGRAAEALGAAGVVHGFQDIGQHRLVFRLGLCLYVGYRAADGGAEARRPSFVGDGVLIVLAQAVVGFPVILVGDVFVECLQRLRRCSLLRLFFVRGRVVLPRRLDGRLLRGLAVLLLRFWLGGKLRGRLRTAEGFILFCFLRQCDGNDVAVREFDRRKEQIGGYQRQEQKRDARAYGDSCFRAFFVSVCGGCLHGKENRNRRQEDGYSDGQGDVHFVPKPEGRADSLGVALDQRGDEIPAEVLVAVGNGVRVVRVRFVGEVQRKVEPHLREERLRQRGGVVALQLGLAFVAFEQEVQGVGVKKPAPLLLNPFADVGTCRVKFQPVGGEAVHVFVIHLNGKAVQRAVVDGRYDGVRMVLQKLLLLLLDFFLHEVHARHGKGGMNLAGFVDGEIGASAEASRADQRNDAKQYE